MGRSARRFLVAFLACAAASTLGLWSLEWPVPGGFPAVTFGSYRSGRFLVSMTAGPEGAPVRAAASGDIAFLFDGDRLPSGLPCPMGGFVALSHPDGMISVYGRLERGSLPSYMRTAAAGDVLGRAGSSGYFRGSEAVFTLYDRVKRQYLNPQVLLPVVRDDRAPLIRGVFLASGERTAVLGEARSLKQGVYEVLADLQDPLSTSDARSRAPYSIRLLIDGKEVVRYVYDAARAEAGRLRFFGAARMDEESYFRAGGRMRLGSFLLSRGRATIVLAVSDYAGNEREISGVVQVE